MPLSYQAFVDAIKRRTAIQTDEQAHQAAVAVLKAINPMLQPNEAHLVAQRLPPAFAVWLSGKREPELRSASDICNDAARTEGVMRSFGIEHAQGVCQSIAERLDDSAWAILQQHLPEDVVTLFIAPERRTARNHVASPNQSRHTLAGGHPGSANPLYSAQPSTSGVLPHSQSVIVSDNPHGDRKLSSAGTEENLPGRSSRV